MLFFPLINVKMPTIVGILTFMSGKNFMLSLVEHEKSFITSRSGLVIKLENKQINYDTFKWFKLLLNQTSQDGMEIHCCVGLGVSVIGDRKSSVVSFALLPSFFFVFYEYGISRVSSLIL